jgi:hypothetical protein
MSKTQILEAKLGHLTGLVLELSKELSPKLHKKFLEDLGEIDMKIRTRGLVDGRTQAWDEERKAKHGEAIAASWAAKREAKGITEVFYKFTHSDAPPIVLKNIEEVAKDCGLSKGTIQNKLVTTPAGIIFRKGRALCVYVRKVGDLETVLSAAAIESGDEDLRVVLPKKMAKRF